jgi:23S rRNA (guanosine2251-2'-O)-methyltransferase
MARAGYGGRVEGTHAVAAAAAAGRIRRLWVDEGRLRKPEVRAVVDSLDAAIVELSPDVRSIAETEAPQGLVAECTPILPVPIEATAGDRAAVVVLDHVEDPHNVGAIARSAAAAGMTGMVLSSKRQAPLSAAAFKSAAGALETLPVAVVGSIPEVLSRLKTQGAWVVGLAAAGGSSLFGLDILTEPVAIVVGAEGAGLSVLVSKRCDLLAAIPMAGASESLNASVSAALACFEIMRLRGGPSRTPG